MRTSRTRLAVTGIVLSLALGAGACGSDDDSASDDTTAPATTPTTSGSATSGGTSTAQPSGPGCAKVPADGAGSFAGMAQDPAATAASNNPLLSTLVTAVQAAGLVDTLNGPGPFTIFAPVNDAFAKIPADSLKTVLADKALLTKILTLHVVSGSKMSSSDLADAGSVTTIEGESLTIAKAAGGVTVNGAQVLCMDVPTANATVHIIDTVLMPA